MEFNSRGKVDRIEGGGGVGIRMSWLENFKTLFGRGMTPIRHQRVLYKMRDI